MAPATELTAAMNHVSYPCERNSNPPAFARFRQVACMPENRRRFFLDQALSSFGGSVALPLATVVAKRTQRLHGVWD